MLYWLLGALHHWEWCGGVLWGSRILCWSLPQWLSCPYPGTEGPLCMWQTLAQWKHEASQWDISRMLMTWKQYQMYWK